MSKWLNIKEYSVLTGISISTIRRKIKENSIKFKQEQGKYLILSEEDDIKPSIENQNTNEQNQSKTNIDFIKFAEKSISSINKLNFDLNQEKEKRLSIQDELIKQLKEEVSELRMLVKVLESNLKI